MTDPIDIKLMSKQMLSRMTISLSHQCIPQVNHKSYLIYSLKGIVHFEIKIWYVSAYPKGIQDVGVFFSSVDPILMFLGQTVLVCQSYNGRYRSLSLWEGKRTGTEKFKLNNSHRNYTLMA